MNIFVHEYRELFIWRNSNILSSCCHSKKFGDFTYHSFFYRETLENITFRMEFHETNPIYLLTPGLPYSTKHFVPFGSNVNLAQSVGYRRYVLNENLANCRFTNVYSYSLNHCINTNARQWSIRSSSGIILFSRE